MVQETGYAATPPLMTGRGLNDSPGPKRTDEPLAVALFRSYSSGRAAKASLVSRYQSIDFLGWRQRLFMASRDSW